MKGKKVVAQIVTYVLVIGLLMAAAYWGSEAVSVLAQAVPLERENTIIIDAGHGGVDGGATSCSGKLESMFNLEIALKLNDLLHLLGYETVMIRSTDCSVYTQGQTIAAQKISDLKERVRVVNETENAVLISIHQNTFSDSRYSGAQVFYSPEGESQALAHALQTAFCTSINPGSNRKCKKADNVYLMQHINCTGVLVECGFLSNAEEEAKLRDADYQRSICCVVASTLSQFLTKDT